MSGQEKLAKTQEYLLVNTEEIKTHLVTVTYGIAQQALPLIALVTLSLPVPLSLKLLPEIL